MLLGFYIGFLEVTWVDMIDILLVAYLIYQLYKLIRGSVAFRIALGVLAIYLTFMLVKAIKMELLTAILGQFIGVGVLAALILFQPEIRRFLLLVGKSAFGREDSVLGLLFRKQVSAQELNIKEIIEAAKQLAGTNTGALMAICRQNDLQTLAQSGDNLDSVLSRRLLISIFNKNSPLHDGSVVIRGNRLVAARCILPVSERNDLPAQFGLRHRAALGLTEATDALVVIVSEETGQISVAHDGAVEHNLTPAELRNKLNLYLKVDTSSFTGNSTIPPAGGGNIFSTATMAKAKIAPGSISPASKL